MTDNKENYEYIFTYEDIETIFRIRVDDNFIFTIDDIIVKKDIVPEIKHEVTSITVSTQTSPINSNISACESIFKMRRTRR